MKKLVVMLVLATSCGGAARLQCPSSRVKVLELDDDTALTCEQANAAIDRACDVIQKTGDWTCELSSMRIMFMGVGAWRNDLGEEVAGTTSWTGAHIVSDVAGACLVHEFFHLKAIREYGGGTPSNYDHGGWADDGRWALDHFHTFMALGPGKRMHGARWLNGVCTPPLLKDYQRAGLRDGGYGDAENAWNFEIGNFVREHKDAGACDANRYP